LDAETTEDYWLAITVIEAQAALVQMNIIGTPHMKRSQAEKLHRELHRKAYPTTHDGPLVGPEELARILGAGRIHG